MAEQPKADQLEQAKEQWHMFNEYVGDQWATTLEKAATADQYPD